MPTKIPKKTIELPKIEVESLEKKYFSNMATRESLAPVPKPSAGPQTSSLE